MKQEEHERETKTAKVEFRTTGATEPAITMTGVAAEIHKSPEKLRALMELLDLPEGTTATVTVLVSSTVVR